MNESTPTGASDEGAPISDPFAPTSNPAPVPNPVPTSNPAPAPAPSPAPAEDSAAWPAPTTPLPPYGSANVSDNPTSPPQPGYSSLAPKHPDATLAMVLGIVAMAGFGTGLLLLAGPVAWVIGSRTVTAIDANPQAYSGRSDASIGRLLGIIATVGLILGILAFGAVIVLIVIVGATTTSSGY